MNNKIKIVLKGDSIIVPKNTTPIREPKNRLFIYESGCDYLVTIPNIFDLVYPNLLSDTIQIIIPKDNNLHNKLHTLLTNNANDEELLIFIYEIPIQINSLSKIVDISREQAKIEGIRQNKKDLKNYLLSD